MSCTSLVSIATTIPLTATCATVVTCVLTIQNEAIQETNIATVLVMLRKELHAYATTVGINWSRNLL